MEPVVAAGLADHPVPVLIVARRSLVAHEFDVPAEVIDRAGQAECNRLQPRRRRRRARGGAAAKLQVESPDFVPGACCRVELGVHPHGACRGKLCTHRATLFSGCAPMPQLEQSARYVLEKYPAIGAAPPVAEGSVGVIAERAADAVMESDPDARLGMVRAQRDIIFFLWDFLSGASIHFVPRSVVAAWVAYCFASFVCGFLVHRGVI
ncbi:unnamed protein product [Prorocentrum cordatum]|uniref:Uncharacterized protein n=1 Tax=Prorocentrum cordatum TaxID=2364126 RepID=A0ABN9Y0R5_9DINO|nr:unnamed protein product [Polarella glacialis]